MREMISEATRTIEDSQTAQALHGLLSLKAPEGSTLTERIPITMKNLVQGTGAPSIQLGQFKGYAFSSVLSCQ